MVFRNNSHRHEDLDVCDTLHYRFSQHVYTYIICRFPIVGFTFHYSITPHSFITTFVLYTRSSLPIMKLTSASIAVAGLVLLPAAATADNVVCRQVTKQGNQPATTTTTTSHMTTTKTELNIVHPTTWITPRVTVTKPFPTAGPGKRRAKTVVITSTFSTETGTFTDSRPTTVC